MNRNAKFYFEVAFEANAKQWIKPMCDNDGLY